MRQCIFISRHWCRPYNLFVFYHTKPYRNNHISVARPYVKKLNIPKMTYGSVDMSHQDLSGCTFEKAL